MVDARTYHERTKHSPESLRQRSGGLNPATKPRPYKAYVDLPGVELSAIRPPENPALSAIAHPSANGGDAGGRSFDRETLATLCYEASGIVEQAQLDDGREMRFRAASCTGKLYHIDLYPVVGDVEGLDPGVYHFDPDSFALDLLREGDYRSVVADAAGSQSGTGASTAVAAAPVTFVCTSTWWRNAWKYRARTYRHAFWDTGTILSNMLATAHAMEQRAEIIAGFADQQIVDLLGLDPEWEAPIALATVGTGASEAPGQSLTSIDPETTPVSSEYQEYTLVHDAWEQSTLADGPAVEDWRGAVTEQAASGAAHSASDSNSGTQVELDPVGPETASKRPLWRTIRRRGSCRDYAGHGPTSRQVATVLDRATRGIPGDWNDGAATGLAFNELFVLCTDVDGLPDGSYHFHPEESILERLGDVTQGEKQHLALNQEWAGRAHVNVYMLANVEQLVDELGNRAYRLAQLEAGITLGRLYLATFAHRVLGGTGLTFFDDLVTDHFAPRADGLTPTCLFAFGRAASG